jgi:hypothetical protein
MAQVAADYDPRSYARKCLDAVESVMYRRSGFDLVNTVIAGQSVSRMTPEQLAFWRNYFKAEVDAEQAAIDMANGKDNGKNILIRFN